jgi:predicted ribosome quality control (RQC) complex YloA/Tae2 family protein
MSLDGFSMYPLVRELNAALLGGRIDKITQPNKQTVLLSIRQPGKNLWLHISVNPQNPVIYIAKNNLESPAAPPVFCMVLRKHIETGRIAEIRQHGLDRIVIIDIDFLTAGGKIVTKSLTIELMGKYSNIILIQDKKIIDSLRKVGSNSSRVRTILPGQDYMLPPYQDKLSLLDSTPKDILQKISSMPEYKLGKALLETCMGFGPVSVKETLFSAGLESSRLIAELDKADLSSIRTALEEILANCSSEVTIPCFVLDDKQKILAMASFPLHYLSEKDCRSFSTISDMLAASTQFSGIYVLPDKERFRKLVHNELLRAENKLEVLRKEATDAQNAEEYRLKADNLMTYQYTLKSHADSQIQITDIYSATGEQIQIELNKRLSIMQNIQAYYHKYDKLKRAQALLKDQLEQCSKEILYLASIETSLDASTSLAEINDIRSELIAGNYLKEKQKKDVKDKPSLPFKFHTPDGAEILIGKNNYQNDKLTFKIAHFNDLWFHTKDIPGSHVILRCNSRQATEKNVFLAACLAAHFSKAGSSSKIPVDYTLCRYVKKPSGAKPGFVIFTNQKTLYITPDINELTPILQSDFNK